MEKKPNLEFEANETKTCTFQHFKPFWKKAYDSGAKKYGLDVVVNGIEHSWFCFEDAFEQLQAFTAGSTLNITHVVKPKQRPRWDIHQAMFEANGEIAVTKSPPPDIVNNEETNQESRAYWRKMMAKCLHDASSVVDEFNMAAGELGEHLNREDIRAIAIYELIEMQRVIKFGGFIPVKING